MKWHKIFAWLTVCCFVMTMITGYKKFGGKKKTDILPDVTED